jgi:hypothetical protein
MNQRFQRTISIDVEVEGEDLHCTSQMVDEYHDITLKMTFFLPSETLVACTAEMAKHPYKPCPGAIEALHGAIGLQMGLGIKKAFRTAVSKEKGCVHISELVDNTFDYLVQKLYWDGVGRDIMDRDQWETLTFAWLNENNTCNAFNSARAFFPKQSEFLPGYVNAAPKAKPPKEDEPT